MPKSYRTVEIMQQCKFGFTPQFINNIINKFTSIEKYAYILHDKDTKTDGTQKEPHIHLLLRFKGPVPTTNILSQFDNTVVVEGIEYKTVKENNLQKCHNWNSAIAYLIHANRIDKFQYNDDKVVSNFDWKEAKNKALNPIKDDTLNSIITAIDNEKMRRYNYMEFVTAQEYVRYKKQIDDAFRYVNDRNISKGSVKNMQVIYITGSSGSGKTTYAKRFCDEHNLSYYVSSGSNDVLDGYGGQDVLILDDLRPSTLGLSDLLKLLDNNTSSTIKSRYYNKNISYCKYIIITTVLDINDFFCNVFKEEHEPIRQFKRRCKTYMVFTHEEIKTYIYSDKISDYQYLGAVPNSIAFEFKHNDITQEQALDFMNDLFKGVTEITKNVVKIEPTLEEEDDDDSDNPFIK